jgi:hypothetical protein
MPDELLLDATETQVDDPQIDDQQIDGQTDQTDTTQQTDEQVDKTPLASLFQADGKRFDPRVSAKLAAIKKENPELGTLMARALNKFSELEREFPGGLTEAKELRDKVEELGGIDGIGEKLEGATELSTLADQFMNADPAFVEDMATSSPESFAALAPQVFDKFAEVNPEGFAAYLGRVVFGDMQRNGLPLMMMRLQDLIPGDNAKLKEAFEAVNGYLGGFKSLSEKPMPTAKPKQAAAKPDNAQQEVLAAREQAWGTESKQAHDQIVNAQYTRAIGDRKPDTEEKAAIKELVMGRFDKRVRELFPDRDKKRVAFFQRNDKAGYLRYMKTIYDRVLPEVVGNAVNFVMRGKGAKATTQRVTNTQQRPQNGQNGGGANYKPVAKEPGVWEIDYQRTSPAMLKQNRAILQNGTMVSWK